MPDRTAPDGEEPESEQQLAGIDPEIDAIVKRLAARLPSIPEPPMFPERETIRHLQELVRDAGRELRRLRRLPRSRTAPLASFREACRKLLGATRCLGRARRDIEGAARKLGRAAGP